MERLLLLVESRGSAPTYAGGSSRSPTGLRIAPVPQSAVRGSPPVTRQARSGSGRARWRSRLLAPVVMAPLWNCRRAPAPETRACRLHVRSVLCLLSSPVTPGPSLRQLRHVAPHALLAGFFAHVL